MSYCRWSTVLHDNYESDLYIYDHVDGFISVNVAATRCAGIENAPRFVPRVEGDMEAFVASYVARNQWRREHAADLKRVPIDLLYAGESKAFTDAAECVAFLEELKKLGYRMPASVLDVSIYERHTHEP